MSRRRGPPPSSKPPKFKGNKPKSASPSRGLVRPKGPPPSGKPNLVRPKGPPPMTKPGKPNTNYNRQIKTVDDGENQNRTKKETQNVVMPSFLGSSPGASKYNSDPGNYNATPPAIPTKSYNNSPAIKSKSSGKKRSKRTSRPGTKPAPPSNKPAPPSNKPAPPSNKYHSFNKPAPPSNRPSLSNSTTPQTLKYKKNEYIEYHSANGWKAGYIESVNEDGTYNVMKENGTIAERWKENFLRPESSRPSTSKMAPPASSPKKLSIKNQMKEKIRKRSISKEPANTGKNVPILPPRNSGTTSSPVKNIPILPPRGAVGTSNLAKNIPILPPRGTVGTSSPVKNIPILPPKNSPIKNVTPIIPSRKNRKGATPTFPNQSKITTSTRTVSPSFPSQSKRTNNKKGNTGMTELQKWLQSIQMEKYYDLFKEQQYTDLGVIKEMDSEDVREMIRDIGIKGGDKSILRKEIKKLKTSQTGGRPYQGGVNQFGSTVQKKKPPPAGSRGMPPPPKARGMPPPPKARAHLPPPSRKKVPSSSPVQSSSSSQFGGLDLSKKTKTGGIDLSIMDTDALVCSTVLTKKNESKCNVCHEKFTFRRTRYECIKCGHNVCKSCAPFDIQDTDWETGKTVSKKVCSDCSNPNKIRAKKYGR